MPLDEDTVRLAQGKNLATVVTLMPDGQPQALLTWVDSDGEPPGQGEHAPAAGPPVGHAGVRGSAGQAGQHAALFVRAQAVLQPPGRRITLFLQPPPGVGDGLLDRPAGQARRVGGGDVAVVE